MRLQLLILLSVAVWFVGCHHSRLSMFPDFVEQKKTFGSVTVISDCMIVQALRGDTDKIDLVENKDIGVRVLDICANTLRQKGYSINNTMLSSVGLMMNHSQVYKVIRTMDDRERHDDQLQLASAPFYVDRGIAHDTTFLLHLGYVYNALINSAPTSEGPAMVVPDAVQLGKSIGGGAIAVVLIGGYNVPVSKGLDEVPKSTSRSPGVVAMQNISNASAMFFVIDTRTGTVLWEDRQFKNGGVVMAEKYFGMIDDILLDLP